MGIKKKKVIYNAVKENREQKPGPEQKPYIYSVNIHSLNENTHS